MLVEDDKLVADIFVVDTADLDNQADSADNYQYWPHFCNQGNFDILFAFGPNHILGFDELEPLEWIGLDQETFRRQIEHNY